MDDVLKRARLYLATNAAESGADVLIAALCDEVESLRRQWDDARSKAWAADQARKHNADCEAEIESHRALRGGQ